MGIVDHIMATPTASIKPALAPPPGIVSNFDDPPSQAYAIIIAIVFFLVSTTPFVLVRLYTRYYINQRLWWDDCKRFPFHILASIVQIHCRGQVWLTPLSDSIVIAWVRRNLSFLSLEGHSLLTPTTAWPFRTHRGFGKAPSIWHWRRFVECYC